MPRPPPELSIAQLRRLWLANHDPMVRQAIEEVALRRAKAERNDAKMRLVEELCDLVRSAWRDEIGGQLVALEHLRAAVNDLRRLRGELPGEKPPPGERPRYDSRYYGGSAK